MFYAGVDHVRHPFDRNFQNCFWPGVEELGSVDVREMTNAIDIAHRICDSISVANVTNNQLRSCSIAIELFFRATRVVVEHADACASGKQSFAQACANEAG